MRIKAGWWVGAAVLAGSPAAWAAGPAWATDVVTYDPGFQYQTLPARPHMDAVRATGSPRHARDVSLGRGGLLELSFGSRVLTNSGDGTPDLRVVEVGPDVERTFVALMPADESTARVMAAQCQDVRAPFRDGFCEIGAIDGGQRSLDIDAYFPGHARGTLRFNAVQLVDDPDQGELSGRSVGADIGGVGAYFHLPAQRAEQDFFAPLAPVTAAPAQSTRPAGTPRATPGGVTTTATATTTRAVDVKATVPVQDGRAREVPGAVRQGSPAPLR